MQIDRTGVWLMLAVACAGGLAHAVRTEILRGFYARHARWRDAPGAFVGTCIDALVTGVALGMLAVCVVVGLAAVLERAGLQLF